MEEAMIMIMMEESGVGSIVCACVSEREKTIDFYGVGQRSLWPVNDN